MPPVNTKRHRPKKWLALAILLFFITWTPAALAQIAPLGLWTGADADIRLSKKFEIGIKGQVRFSDNIQVTRAFLGEAGLTYKLNKAFSLSGYYRYTGRLKKNTEATGYYYRPYHRFYAEAAYKQKIAQGLKFSYRLRYQNQFMDDNESVVADKSYLRNKIELSYSNLSRFTPFISADLFYRIDHQGTTDGFNQIRYKTGTNVRITKRHSVDLYFFLDKALGANTELPEPVMGATYKFDLNLAKANVTSNKHPTD